MGNDFLPVFLTRGLDGSFHEAEIFRPVIGPDIEMIFVMAHRVEVVFFPWKNDFKLPIGPVGVEVTEFTAERMVRPDHEEFFRLGFEDAGAESFILLFVDKSVFTGIRTENVPVDLKRPEGNGILLGIEERSAVLGPGAPG